MSQSVQRPPESEYKTLNLGCGDKQLGDAWNVDVVPTCDPDEVVDLNAYPWPWPDESFETVLAYHVFEHLADIEAALRESERVLTPGGRLVTRWPVGLDAIADPDHKRMWTWRTPEYYCGKRHWDTDVGLEIAARDVRLWPMVPGGLRRVYKRFLARWLDRHGPGPWCFYLPCSAGEFEVVFRKP